MVWVAKTKTSLHFVFYYLVGVAMAKVFIQNFGPMDSWILRTKE